VNPNQFGTNTLNLSGVSRWLVFFGVLWLLGLLGLGWLVRSLLVLVLLLMLLPALAFFGLQWWLRRSLVQGKCPSCESELIGLNQAQIACPSCGEALRVEGDRFIRATPPGTIDVEAVDITSHAADE